MAMKVPVLPAPALQSTKSYIEWVSQTDCIFPETAEMRSNNKYGLFTDYYCNQTTRGEPWIHNKTRCVHSNTLIIFEKKTVETCKYAHTIAWTGSLGLPLTKSENTYFVPETYQALTGNA